VKSEGERRVDKIDMLVVVGVGEQLTVPTLITTLNILHEKKMSSISGSFPCIPRAIAPGSVRSPTSTIDPAKFNANVTFKMSNGSYL
jgi:hypothetical protein